MEPLSFEQFEAEFTAAPTTKILPEGIRFRGRLFRDSRLRFRVGQKVRVAIDFTLPGAVGLLVFSKRTGKFMCIAMEHTPEWIPVMSLDFMQDIGRFIDDEEDETF